MAINNNGAIKTPWCCTEKERCHYFHHSSGNHHLKERLMCHFHRITNTRQAAYSLDAFHHSSSFLGAHIYDARLWLIHSFNEVYSHLNSCSIHWHCKAHESLLSAGNNTISNTYKNCIYTLSTMKSESAVWEKRSAAAPSEKASLYGSESKN